MSDNIGVQLLERSGIAAVTEKWSLFENTGLPARKYEEYKFTPMTAALEKNLTQGSFAGREMPAGISTEVLLDTPHQVIFYNGKMVSCEISSEEIEVSNLGSLPNDQRFHPEWKDPFHLMNQAVDADGIYVKVRKGSTVEKPIYVRYLVDKSNEQAMSLSRNYFHTEENSELTVLEEYIYLGSHSSFDNTETHFIADKSSRLKSFKLQMEGEEQLHVGNIFVQQERDSVFSNTTVTFKGKMVRNNVQVRQNDEHCETHLLGLYMLNGKSHVDNHTTVDHRNPNSYSNELYKGILSENSTGVFNGKIYVRPDAQRTNAFQSNNNILLSETATLHTKPQLEIWADDVKCSHGCTSGQLDEEALFYLQTRGLSKDQSRALLLKAFAAEIVEEIELEQIREHISKRVDSILFNS